LLLTLHEDSTVVEYAKSITQFEFSNWIWTGLCQQVMNHSFTSPVPSASAEEALRTCPPRKVGESFDAYYKTYKELLKACIWVRKLYNKDVSHDWVDTYHRQWMVNLKFANASVLSAMIMPNSTFANVFTIA
jgi:hypothetical protein